MAADAWYYAKDGQRVGPVTAAQLQQLVSSGQLPATTQVWSEALGNWKPLNTVPELMAGQSAPPPPPPPSFSPPPPPASGYAGVQSGFGGAASSPFANLNGPLNKELWSIGISGGGLFLILLSMFLPWYKVKNERDAKIEPASLDNDYRVAVVVALPGGSRDDRVAQDDEPPRSRSRRGGGGESEPKEGDTLKTSIGITSIIGIFVFIFAAGAGVLSFWPPKRWTTIAVAGASFLLLILVIIAFAAAPTLNFTYNEQKWKGQSKASFGQIIALFGVLALLANSVLQFFGIGVKKSYA